MSPGVKHAPRSHKCGEGANPDRDRNTVGYRSRHDRQRVRDPYDDRYQILVEHEPSHLRALDTGLGFTRTASFVLLEIFSRRRTREAKTSFYASIKDELQNRCDIAPSDVMVVLQQNSDED